MGCDIHMFVEIREEWRPKTWQTVGRVFPYAYHRPDEIPTLWWEEDHEEELNPVMTMHPYTGRNYDLFAVLAGVRGNAEPIASPRGLPDDVSGWVAYRSEWWGTDAHSRSYLMLEELQAQEWTERCASFAAVVERLAEIRNRPGVLGLRIVFWFDN